MKILFLADDYQGLARPIEEEMKRQGHDVTPVYMVQNCVKHDPYRARKRLKFRRYFSLWYQKYVCNEYNQYWQETISKKKAFSNAYDILFVINGITVNEYLMNHLKQFNPNIKTVLYLWDCTAFYHFQRLFPLFDMVYSFDIGDCERDKRLNLLPMYYMETKATTEQKANTNSYDFFFIGSNWDGRYLDMKKIATYLKRENYTYCIKVVDERWFSWTRRDRIRYKLLRLLLPNEKKYFGYVAFNRDDDTLHIKSRKSILKDEYNALMDASKVVVDFYGKEEQTGLSPRFIWALAHGKKIVTNNPHVYRYKFVSPKQVQVINIDDMHISPNFVNTPISHIPDISFCRIDNWVSTLLSMKRLH